MQLGAVYLVAAAKQQEKKKNMEMFRVMETNIKMIQNEHPRLDRYGADHNIRNSLVHPKAPPMP